MALPYVIQDQYRVGPFQRPDPNVPYSVFSPLAKIPVTMTYDSLGAQSTTITWPSAAHAYYAGILYLHTTAKKTQHKLNGIFQQMQKKIPFFEKDYDEILKNITNDLNIKIELKNFNEAVMTDVVKAKIEQNEAVKNVATACLDNKILPLYIHFTHHDLGLVFLTQANALNLLPGLEWNFNADYNKLRNKEEPKKPLPVEQWQHQKYTRYEQVQKNETKKTILRSYEKQLRDVQTIENLETLKKTIQAGDDWNTIQEHRGFKKIFTCFGLFKIKTRSEKCFDVLYQERQNELPQERAAGKPI